MSPMLRSWVIVVCVFPVAHSLFCANSFSFTSSAHVRRLPTRSHEPLILSLPNLLSDDQSSRMLQSIESSIQNGTLKSTASYQEDIFSRDKWGEEDHELRAIVRSLSNERLLPSEHSTPREGGVDPDAALRAFVYAVTNFAGRLSEDDIIRGANIIQRRKALERWKGDGGRRILQSSADGGADAEEVDWSSIRPGTRYEVPPAILRELQPLVPRLLRGPWTTRDATLVKYGEGESQVPHLDPCDATLLLCLKGGDEGGDTCFPSLERPLRLEHQAGSGILFFSSRPGQGDAKRDARSLHHGGKVARGEKVVVQLMLHWDGDPVPSWLAVLA